MRLIRYTNKYLLNPLMMKIIAPHGPFAIIHHTGRKSKRHYATPIIAIPIKNGFLLALTYGQHVDWYKNVLAAHSCIVEKHGKKYQIIKIKKDNNSNEYKRFPKPLNIFLKIMKTTHYVELLYR